MTIDPKCYALAKVWLKDGGWTYSGDIHKLAQEIQDVCEAFTSALADRFEQEAEHGRNHLR